MTSEHRLRVLSKITFEEFKTKVEQNKILFVYDKKYNSLFYDDILSVNYENWYIHADVIILDGVNYYFKNIIEYYKYWFWKLNLKKYGFKDK
jgi:uncharacterized protein YqkB